MFRFEGPRERSHVSSSRDQGRAPSAMQGTRERSCVSSSRDIKRELLCSFQGPTNQAVSCVGVREHKTACVAEDMCGFILPPMVVRPSGVLPLTRATEGAYLACSTRFSDMMIGWRPLNGED